MKYQSHAAAIETLRAFFSNQPSSDVASLQDIYAAAGRDLSNPELNKTWVANKLTHLKHYQLVEPIYARSAGNRKMLDKIQLTHEGSIALGRETNEYPAQPAIPTNSGFASVTLESIATDIKAYMKENPSIEIQLSVKLKDLPTQT